MAENCSLSVTTPNTDRLGDMASEVAGALVDLGSALDEQTGQQEAIERAVRDLFNATALVGALIGPVTLCTTVWAVNYASEVDWECLRDDGYDSVEEIANINCLPQLYASCQEALDAGQRQWLNDLDPEDNLAPVHEDVSARASDDTTTRTLKNDAGDFVVLIYARELTLPVTR